MTLELRNIDRLPEELVRYIYEFDKPYIDYINNYDVLNWKTVEDSIYENTESCDLIESIDEIVSKINPSVYTLKREKWMYYDYIKMHPGKRYFWCDELTNYGGYNEKLLEFLQSCDALIYSDEKYYSRITYINDLYKLILS